LIGGITSSFLNLGSLRSFHEVGVAQPLSLKVLVLIMKPVPVWPTATARSSLNSAAG
jgi:hypothetical protein